MESCFKQQKSSHCEIFGWSIIWPHLQKLIINSITISQIVLWLEKIGSFVRDETNPVLTNLCCLQVGKAEFLGRATGRPHVDLEDNAEPYSSPHLEWFQVMILFTIVTGWYLQKQVLFCSDLPRQRRLWWALGCLWAFWTRRLWQVELKLIWTLNICWKKNGFGNLSNFSSSSDFKFTPPYSQNTTTPASSASTRGSSWFGAPSSNTTGD